MFLLSDLAVALPSDAAFPAKLRTGSRCRIPKGPVNISPPVNRLIMIVHLAYSPLYNRSRESPLRIATLNDRHAPLTRHVRHFTLHLPQRVV